MKDLEDKLKKKEKAQEKKKKERVRNNSEEKYQDLPSSIYHKLYR